MTRAPSPHVEILKQVDGLILCFPHWWFSMPAMLKGWVDRVWAPGTAFLYDSKDGHLKPNLHNIKLFGVVTSYGSSWWIVRVFAGDAGRKVLMRGMKPLCAKDAQSFYLATQHGRLHAGSRETFLEGPAPHRPNLRPQSRPLAGNHAGVLRELSCGVSA
jgi:putative NADPH-quinone reductase